MIRARLRAIAAFGFECSVITTEMTTRAPACRNQRGARGAIQASAGAYARLRQDFLFRPRGTFYLPGVGQSRTFVLAGQL